MRRPCRRLRALVAVVALLAGPAPGLAQPPSGEAAGDGPDRAARVLLRWRAPAGCPQEAELREAARAWLGRDAFVADEGAEDFVLRGEIVRRGRRRWLARLELRGRDGRSVGVRLLEGRGRRCGGLARPLPLVVAMLANLPAPRRPLVVPPADEPETAAGEPRGLRPAGPEVFLGLSAEASLGQVPGPVGLGLGVSGGLRWPSGWRVGSGMWWLPGGTEPAFGGLAGLSYVALTMSGCAAVPGAPAWAPGPCLRGFLGRSERWGEGYVHDRRAERLHIALEASWPLRRPLSRWAAAQVEIGLRWVAEPPELVVRVDGQPRRAFVAATWTPVLRLALELGRPPATRR